MTGNGSVLVRSFMVLGGCGFFDWLGVHQDNLHNTQIVWHIIHQHIYRRLCIGHNSSRLVLHHINSLLNMFYEGSEEQLWTQHISVYCLLPTPVTLRSPVLSVLSLIWNLRVWHPAHLSLIDDEQRRRIEAIGRLPLQHRLQAAKLIQDWFKEVLPQTLPVVHVLVEGLAEAFDRQAAAVVLVPAEVVTCVQLVHLQRRVRNGLTQEFTFFILLYIVIYFSCCCNM